MTTLPWKTWIGDARFWVLLFFVVRLYGITNPPIDPASTWRQCDVLMIARNFYEIDSNIFYPRVDLGGKDGSIVGVEFPIYNYTIYLVSSVFGYQDWYGRIINLVLVTLSLLLLHKVLTWYLSEEAAFYATMVFLFSGWFAYSRITIPDVFAGSLCIISLYFAFAYFRTGRIVFLLVFTAIAALGSLSKITAAPILTVLLAPMLDHRVAIARKFALVGSAVVILALVIAWYFYWVPHLNSIGMGGYFFMGAPIKEALAQLLEQPGAYLLEIYEAPLKYIGGTLFVISILLAIRQHKGTVVAVLCLPFLVFCLLLLKIGDAFLINGYYFLLLVPSMAMVVGYGISLLQNRKVQLAVIILIAVENVGNQVHIFQVRPAYQSYPGLEKIFDRLGGSDELVAIGNEGSPMARYFCHRKGLNYRLDFFQNPENIASLRQNGFTYVLIIKRETGFENVNLEFPVVYDSDEFKVYKL